MVGNRTCVGLPQHGPLSPYTRLEDASVAKIKFLRISHNMAFKRISRALRLARSWLLVKVESGPYVGAHSQCLSLSYPFQRTHSTTRVHHKEAGLMPKVGAMAII